MLRVKVCIDCRVYVPIKAHDFVANKKLLSFERKHRCHSTQTIAKDELQTKNQFDPIYTEVE